MQAVADAHGGRVEVRSAPGAGTTVVLTLPAAAEIGAARTSPTAPTPQRILAVEDDQWLRELVELMLSADGHTVRVAATGEDALAELDREPVDVVVTDLALGDGLDGWGVAAPAKQRWPGTRVVLATGWGAAVDAAAARARGVDAVVAKPFRRDDLRRVLTPG